MEEAQTLPLTAKCQKRWCMIAARLATPSDAAAGSAAVLTAPAAIAINPSNVIVLRMRKLVPSIWCGWLTPTDRLGPKNAGC